MSKEQEWASKQVTMFNEDHRKQNSRDARERSFPKQGTDKAGILYILKLWSHKHKNNCMSAIDICKCSLMDYHAVQRRMSELVRAELVEVCGKRDGYSLYRIKEEAK